MLVEFRARGTIYTCVHTCINTSISFRIASIRLVRSRCVYILVLCLRLPPAPSWLFAQHACVKHCRILPLKSHRTLSLFISEASHSVQDRPDSMLATSERSERRLSIGDRMRHFLLSQKAITAAIWSRLWQTRTRRTLHPSATSEGKHQVLSRRLSFVMHVREKETKHG